MKKNTKKRFITVLSFFVMIVASALAATPAQAAVFCTGTCSNGSGISTNDLTLGTLTPTDLVNELLGGGVTVSNVTYTGSNASAGNFSGGTGIIGFENGIILSTGKVSTVIGPNDLDGATTSWGLPGDADLNSLIPGYTTFDAAVLQFDFVPSSTGAVTFEYVFGSEEYNEFANSPFNNVFGFFLDGQNIALLPGVSPPTPVSINNVNGGNPLGTNANNSAFYVNNQLAYNPGFVPGPLNTQLDGLTVVLNVTANVNASQKYHMKLAIADAGDSILDSDVFIKASSFKIVPPKGRCPTGDCKFKTWGLLGNVANPEKKFEMLFFSPIPNGGSQGRMKVEDNKLGMTIESTRIDTLVTDINAGTGTATGRAHVTGGPHPGDYDFTVNVKEAAQSNTPRGTFELILSGFPGGYDNSGPLTFGAISIIK